MLKNMVKEGLLKQIDTAAVLSTEPFVTGEEIIGGTLTATERKSLEDAKATHPKATTFWVLVAADEVDDTDDDDNESAKKTNTRRKKMNTRGLGINQRVAIEFIQSVGGAANTWKIQLETGIGSATYLHQLVERGIMKKVDTRALLSTSPIPPGTKPIYGEEIKGGNLTQKERQALNRAKKQNPRAYVFWVLASAAKRAIDDVLGK